MKAFHVLVPVVGILCLVTGRLTADQPAAKDLAALREKVIKASTSEEKAEAYQAYFEKVGRAGLARLTADEDVGIALQAAWEAHTKPMKRPKPIRWRAGDVYDPEELAKFVKFLKERTGAPVPEWWAKNVVAVDYFPGAGHSFPIVAVPPNALSKKNANELDPPRIKDLLEILDRTEAGKKFDISDDVIGDDWTCYDWIFGKEMSFIAGYDFLFGGGTFHLGGFDSKSGKQAWNAAGWVSQRNFSGIRVYMIQLKEKADSVYVFGVESSGMYLEAYDRATGKCRYRFCTNYWGNYSEKWRLK